MGRGLRQDDQSRMLAKLAGAVKKAFPEEDGKGGVQWCCVCASGGDDVEVAPELIHAVEKFSELGGIALDLEHAFVQCVF